MDNDITTSATSDLKTVLDTIILCYCDFLVNGDDPQILVDILKIVTTAYNYYNVDKPELPPYIYIYIYYIVWGVINMIFDVLCAVIMEAGFRPPQYYGNNRSMNLL